MKRCPYCAEEIQEEAVKCKHCGEMLTAAAPTSIPPQTERISQPKGGSPAFKAIGVLLMLIGVGIVAYFFMLYDTSVEAPMPANYIAGVGSHWHGERVYNTGLMQNRQNGIIIGLAVAGAGLACFLVGQFSTGSSAPKTAPVIKRSPIKGPLLTTVKDVCVVLFIVLFLGFLAYFITGAMHETQQFNKMHGP